MEFVMRTNTFFIAIAIAAILHSSCCAEESPIPISKELIESWIASGDSRPISKEDFSEFLSAFEVGSVSGISLRVLFCPVVIHCNGETNRVGPRDNSGTSGNRLAEPLLEAARSAIDDDTFPTHIRTACQLAVMEELSTPSLFVLGVSSANFLANRYSDGKLEENEHTKRIQNISQLTQKALDAKEQNAFSSIVRLRLLLAEDNVGLESGKSPPEIKERIFEAARSSTTDPTGFPFRLPDTLPKIAFESQIDAGPLGGKLKDHQTTIRFSSRELLDSFYMSECNSLSRLAWQTFYNGMLSDMKVFAIRNRETMSKSDVLMIGRLTLQGMLMDDLPLAARCMVYYADYGRMFKAELPDIEAGTVSLATVAYSEDKYVLGQRAFDPQRVAKEIEINVTEFIEHKFKQIASPDDFQGQDGPSAGRGF